MPIINFYFRTDTKKYRNKCKKCRSEDQKKISYYYKKKNKNKNPFNKKLKLCSKCKKWKIRSKENWYKVPIYKDGLNYVCKLCFHKFYIENKFDLFEGEFIKILKKHTNCQICGKNIKYKSKCYPCFDHDHKLESKGIIKLRGIICQDCNVGLGSFKDNLYILIKAIKYLKYNKI